MTWKLRELLIILAVLMPVNFPVHVNASNDTIGTIKGQVNYCAQGGYVGMQVFIPGRQFSAYLGQDGHFIFEGVPAGAFNLNYLINGRLVHETNNVVVTAGEVTDLGKMAFCDSGAARQEQPASPTPEALLLSKCEDSPQLPECQDADKDGVIAIKDCNDSDAAIYPGADELCDAIDNNCDGRVDEVLKVTIPNGIGLCKNSVVTVDSCSKGFADCDKDPANGCETDIYNDNNNCGACGNECSALEICKLGIC
ncbi:MopE-related protein [Kaarinaea lacus]